MPEDTHKEVHKIRDRLQRIAKPFTRPLDRARAMYAIDSPYVVREKQVPLIHLIDDFAIALNFMFSEIRVIGSAYLGMSLHKNTMFATKHSDIDLAVISESRYSSLLRCAHQATAGYSDLTSFEPENVDFFRQSSLQGYIDPLTLPKCDERDLWKNVLDQLTDKYDDHFKEVTAMVYCGPWFLEQKMTDYIDKNLYRNYK